MAKSSDLLFRILGKDVSASKTLKGVGREAGNAGKAMHGIGVGAVALGSALGSLAVGGISALVGGFGDLLAGARDAAKITRLNEQVIKSTGGAANVTAGQIDDLSTALSNKTGIDDDAIKSSANLLLTFTNIRNEVGKGNDIFNQATAAVQDMSAALGQDAKSSAIQLGKALNDPVKGITALQKVGVSFTAEQRAMADALVNGGILPALKAMGAGTVTAKVWNDTLKASNGNYDKAAATILGKWNPAQKKMFDHLTEGGHALEAQQMILKELGKEFGGAAEAASDPMMKLGTVLTNLGEGLVTKLLPAIDSAATFIVDQLLPAMEQAFTWIDANVIPVVKNLAAQFMKNVWPALVAVGKQIATNLAPATASLAKLWRETLQPALRDAMPTIKAVIAGVAAFVAGWLVFQSKILGVVIPVFATLVEWILKVSKYVRDAAAGMQSAFVGVASAIYNAFRGAFNGIASLWNNTVGRLSFGVPDWIPGMGGKGWDVPNIPMLAKGGIVTRPTLALIGEAGPEAVVPLSRGGMGGGVVVNINGPVAGPGAGRWLLGEIEAAIRQGGARPNVLATR
jgi:hypothetical protein